MSLKYQNNDIRNLASELIAAFSIGGGGVNTKSYKTVINEDTLELENVLSFSVNNTGTVAGYFTHDPLNAIENRQTIEPEEVLNFGGSTNFFSYLKVFAPGINTTITVTYILKA